MALKNDAVNTMNFAHKKRRILKSKVNSIILTITMRQLKSLRYKRKADSENLTLADIKREKKTGAVI